MNKFCCVIGTLTVASIVIGGQWLATAQQPAAKPRPATTEKRRFEFDVVSSFDGKYVGDTPGHLGRSGGLGERRPNVALGDPVFRGEQPVGTVTTLTWNRAQGSLEVEFDPAQDVKIRVGDSVWLWLDGPGPKEN